MWGLGFPAFSRVTPIICMLKSPAPGEPLENQSIHPTSSKQVTAFKTLDLDLQQLEMPRSWLLDCRVLVYLRLPAQNTYRRGSRYDTASLGILFISSV